MSPKARQETLGHQTHTHEGRRYLCYSNGKCWFCGEIVKEEEMQEATLYNLLPEVDTDTGEITGQLTLMGLALDTVETQRRAGLEDATIDEIIRAVRQMEEGDRVTVTFKGGRRHCKLVEGWRHD